MPLRPRTATLPRGAAHDAHGEDEARAADEVAWLGSRAAALRLAAPRALVLTCSCSSHIDEPSFRGAVLAAAADARPTATLLESRGAGEDHPVVRWFPEGRYLKALWLEVR